MASEAHKTTEKIKLKNNNQQCETKRFTASLTPLYLNLNRCIYLLT